MAERRLWALGLDRKGRKPLHTLVEKKYYQEGLNGYYENGFWIWTPGKVNYHVYIKSNFWKRLKEIYFESVNEICEGCGSVAKQLHHITYNNLGMEQWNDLKALCLDCHYEAHGGVIDIDSYELGDYDANEYGRINDARLKLWKQERLDELKAAENKRLLDKLIRKYVEFENDINIKKG